MKVWKCKCGRRKAKLAMTCTKCAHEKHEQCVAKAKAIVGSNCCPDCGDELKRNLAMTGWYQCVQFGNEDFRKNPAAPSCGFQCFTS